MIAEAGATGTVKDFLQVGQSICEPLESVSHNIFCPQNEQVNLNRL